MVASIALEFLDGDRVRTVAGAPDTLPESSFQVERGNTAVHAFRAGAGQFELQLTIPSDVSRWRSPVFTLDDLQANVRRVHDTPVTYIDWRQNLGTRTDEIVRLAAYCADDITPGPGAMMQERTAGPVNVRFYWPAAPTGIIAGYTAPLHGWIGTTITGLTPQPFTLRGMYAQSYRPGHHNFM